MLCEFFKLNELGDFGVRAGQPVTKNELRVMSRIFFDEFTDDFANRVVCVGDAEEDLRPAGVILVEPALKGFGGGSVAAFQWFEQGDCGRK